MKTHESKYHAISLFYEHKTYAYYINKPMLATPRVWFREHILHTDKKYCILYALYAPQTNLNCKCLSNESMQTKS